MIIKIEHWVDNERKFELTITTNDVAHSILSDNPHLEDHIIGSIHRVLTSHLLLHGLIDEKKGNGK